jgi:septal ring factor EnvC (AmiA/AmiB activator)
MTETRVNGGELSDKQMEALAFTFADHLRVKGELDQARDEIAALRQQLTGNAVEIEGLRSLRNHFENMMHEYAAERDGAVADRAKCESIIENLRSILRDYPIKEQQ